MNDDYLWDRTGEPDPNLARLEEVLGSLRWSTRKSASCLPKRVVTSRLVAWSIAAAATLTVGLGTAVIMYRTHVAQPLTSWQLSFSGEKPKPMHAGQLVETTATTRGAIQAESVGRVEIEPESRLQLVAATPDLQRLALDHGTIHAFIWAPPAHFVVDTPAAKAVDLGCQYTLHVGKDGVGLLKVQMGWVAFEWRGVESFIPAGAACTTRPGHGPDIPYFLDASPLFKNAIAELNIRPSEQSLSAALAVARPRDAFTLWHMLQRTPANQRGRVFDRFAELVSLPSGVNREAILRGDKRSLDVAWDALNLGSTSWWREWKRRW